MGRHTLSVVCTPVMRARAVCARAANRDGSAYTHAPRRETDLPVAEAAANSSRGGYNVAASEEENHRQSRSGSLSARLHEAPTYGSTGRHCLDQGKPFPSDFPSDSPSLRQSLIKTANTGKRKNVFKSDNIHNLQCVVICFCLYF